MEFGLAYVKFPQGELWRSKADGSEPLQLTFHPLIAYDPHWSPDGKRIAYSGLKLGGQCGQCGACRSAAGVGTRLRSRPEPSSRTRRLRCRCWFRAMWWVTTQKNGASALGLQRVLGLKKYETAWTLLHKLRRAMVRPGRDLLTGRVEVDECYIGALEEGLMGRLNLDKALVVVAAQKDGPGIGRIRMRQILNASAESLIPFVQDSIVPGSVVHTDGWLGYLPLESKGYKHDVTIVTRKKKSASEL